MIAKRILPRKEKLTRPHYDIIELAEYIRAADHEDEKCQLAWHVGCHSEPYDQAMTEIMAIQALNTRSSKDKTYHLVISFRPEDEAKLSSEVFQKIENMFAKALGFEEHQRVCGVHRNTNNMHMHIAYNKIHPEKLTIREPHRDFHKLAGACKTIEVKYGLVMDNKLKNDQQIDQHAASMEAHSGEQSFQSYVLERKEPLLQALVKAASWREAHEFLSRHGLGIKARGNGLVVYNLDGKKNEVMKASALDRCLSKKSLLDRFGAYESPHERTAPVERYSRIPIHPSSDERDQLYEQYKNLMQEKQDRLDASRKQSAKDMQAVMNWAAEERKALDRRILSRSIKTKLRQILNVKQRQYIENVREECDAALREIRKSYPCHNWNGYLKWQAEQGNTAALNVLRSKAKKRGSEADKAKNHEKCHKEAHLIKRSYLEKEQQIIMSSVSWKRRRGLVSIIRMQQLAALEILQKEISPGGGESKIFSGVRHAIDNNGIIIFTLADGGTIRDTGQKIYFSQDGVTKRAAMLYSQSRLGKNIQVVENYIERKPYERNSNRADHHKSNPAGVGQNNNNRLRGLSELDVVRFGNNCEVLLPGHARGNLER
jgi:hypothetical protein